MLNCWILQKAITTWHPVSKYDIHRQCTHMCRLCRAYVTTIAQKSIIHPPFADRKERERERRADRERGICKIQYKNVVKFIVEIFLRLRIYGGAAEQGSICHRISACCAHNSIIIINYVPREGHVESVYVSVCVCVCERDVVEPNLFRDACFICTYFLSRHFLTQTDKNVRKYIYRYGKLCAGCWQSIWSSANGWNNDALAIFEMMAIYVRARHTQTRPPAK